MFSRKSDAGKRSGAALRGDRTASMNGRWPVAAGQALLVVVFAAAGLVPNDAEAQAPIVVKPLEDLTLAVGTGPHLVDLRGVYYGELDKCEAVSSNQAVATVTLTAGYDVHVTPVGVGEATITATATNEDGSADHAFKVNVQHAPPAPVGELADLTITVGGDPVTVAVAEAFSGSALMYSAVSSASDVASVSVADSAATVMAHAAGTATITVTASNSEGRAEQTFTVTAKYEPPAAVGELADLTVTVGGDPVTVDVAEAFSGSALMFSAASSASDVASVSVADSTATVVAHAAGTATITVTASNSEGRAEQTFTVTAKYEPPAPVGELADLTITVGGDPVTVDVAEAFSGSALMFTAASSASDVADVSVADSAATVMAHAAGTATITVTASNSEGRAEQTFTVTAKYEPPVPVGELADLTITVGGEPVTVAVAEAFSGSALMFSAASSASDVASVSVADSAATVVAHAAGTATITVTASNSEGRAEQTFTVTAEYEPPAPVGELADLTITVGDDPVAVAVAEAFSGSALMFSAASSAGDVAGVSVADSAATVVAHTAGTAMITVTASNSEGRAEQTFTVTVKDEPPAPVGELADLTVTVGDEPVAIDVAAAFSGSALMFSATSSAGDVAGVSVADSAATVVAHTAGTATITVTASNSEGRAEQTFTVTVEYGPPAAVGELADLTITVGDDPVAIDVAAAFAGNALMFSAASSASEAASVSVDDSAATVMAHAAGTATITVTASNSEGRAEQTFTVTVKDEPPAAVGELADLTITIGDDPVAIDVAGAFSGSALMFSAASSASDVAGVSLADATATVTAVAAGTATVTITASNSAGSAGQSFVVTVKDVPPAAAGTLPDVALIAGGEAALVDAAGGFTGTALVYSVTMSGDAVGVAVAGSQVTVTPLVEGEATVTVTASNTEGAATQSFTATVATDVAESDALENTVAAIARSTLASVNSAIGARFRAERMAVPARDASAFTAANAFQIGTSAGYSTPHTGGFQPGWLQQSSTVYGTGPAAAWSYERGPLASQSGLQQLVGRSFTMPLNAAGGSGAWTPAADWTFWGHVDRQSFEGSGYDGSLTSIYLGADADFGEQWLAGVAVSQSSGDADYKFSSARASGTGDLDTEMVSVYPYVHWAIDDVAEVWAIAGAGWGDVELDRSATAQAGEADLSMWMLSAGGRRTLASGAEWNFALTGDAGILEMQTDGGVGIIDDMNVSVGRVKVAVEGERIIVAENGNTFSVFGQVGGRHDSGDGDTGSGAELMGGVRYDTAGRIRFEAKARLLSMHSAQDYEENGVSFSAMVRPRPDGTGMSVALSSYHGTGMSDGSRQPQEQGYGYAGQVQRMGPEIDPWGMNARLGYALRVQRLSGFVTPFAQFDMAGDDGHGMRLGLRYDLANSGSSTMFNLEFTGGQEYDRFRREAHNMVQLRGELRF